MGKASICLNSAVRQNKNRSPNSSGPKNIEYNGCNGFFSVNASIDKTLTA
jgi:hypothetical protein